MRSLTPWLALAALSEAVTGCSALTLRFPNVCQAFHLCSPPVSTSTQIKLAAAREAANQLKEATHFRSYHRAAVDLDRELIKLSDVPLSPVQKREVDRLLLLNRTAQIVVLEETNAEVILDQASRAITAASRLWGAEQRKQLAQVRRQLLQIPGRSFAYERTRRLLQELERLKAPSEFDTQNANEEPLSKAEDSVAPPQPALPPPSHGDLEGGQQPGWRHKPLF